MKTTAVLFLALLLSSTAGLRAGIVVLGQNSTTALAYAGATSATDLINAGQATLASAAVTPSHGSFSGNGINDGVRRGGSAPGQSRSRRRRRPRR